MKKRIISTLSVILILCVLTMTVYAKEVPDLDRTGSISITMTYEDAPVPGGSLTLYRVAEVQVENDADYSFRYTQEYAACEIALDDLSAAQTAQDLAAYTQEQSIAGTKLEIDENGYICFQELPLGLYLMVQEDPAEGYNPANPFLVSVPGMEDGSYIYEVNASPKLQLELAPTEPPTETTPPDLPQTGLNQWPIPVLAIGGLLLVVLGVCLFVAGKKRNHES